METNGMENTKKKAATTNWQKIRDHRIGGSQPNLNVASTLGWAVKSDISRVVWV